MQKEKIQIYMDKDQMEQVRELSRVTMAPIAAIIRAAIAAYLKKEGK